MIYKGKNIRKAEVFNGLSLLLLAGSLEFEPEAGCVAWRCYERAEVFSLSPQS